MSALHASRNNSSLEILLVGDALSDDLAAAVAELRDWAARGSIASPRIVRAPDVDTAVVHLESPTAAPVWIAVLQSWPGQVPAADLHRLRRSAPLAPLCGVLGSWCEGETRSGKPWPGTLRCSWNLWLGRLAREMAGAVAGRATPWSLPATSSSEELLLAAVALQENEPAPSDRGLLAVVAKSRETRSALVDAAQARGYRTVAFAAASGVPAEGAVAALWDTSPDVATDAAAVQGVLAAVGQAPLLALVGFPRAEDIARARAAGIAAVLAKPYLLDDMLWRIEELTGSKR